MAEPAGTSTTTEAPKVLPALLIYTAARLAVVAVLVAVIWVAGLPGTPAFLFGLLLAMPISYLLLKPLRARLTGALVARAERKERLRAELRGSDTDDGTGISR
jgi:hypothetical protein